MISNYKKHANTLLFIITDTINASQDNKESLKITRFTSSIVVKQVYYNKEEFK